MTTMTCNDCDNDLREVRSVVFPSSIYFKCYNCMAIWRITRNGIQHYGDCGSECDRLCERMGCNFVPREEMDTFQKRRIDYLEMMNVLLQQEVQNLRHKGGDAGYDYVCRV